MLKRKSNKTVKVAPRAVKLKDICHLNNISGGSILPQFDKDGSRVWISTKLPNSPRYKHKQLAVVADLSAGGDGQKLTNLPTMDSTSRNYCRGNSPLRKSWPNN